jgi:hypothetical protein
MKKSKKLLRKLLADYREKLAKMPCNKQRSRIVDAITFLIEEGFYE